MAVRVLPACDVFSQNGEIIRASNRDIGHILKSCYILKIEKNQIPRESIFDRKRCA